MANARIAAISGGLGDIGQACAIALAKDGCDIAVCDVADDRRTAQLQSEVEAAGRRFHFAVADVSDPSSVTGWFDAIEQCLGHVDIALVNAAIVEQASLREVSQDSWDRHLSINLTGAMFVANTAASRMSQLGRAGRIVFIGSWAAAAPHRHVPAYCVAKAGVRMLCRLMALEYAADGIQVCEVAPGLVNAGLSRQIFEQDPAVRERMKRQPPVGRLIQAGEVAWHVVHCCDPQNRNMTGATLLCDGGLSLLSAAEGARDGGS